MNQKTSPLVFLSSLWILKLSSQSQSPTSQVCTYLYLPITTNDDQPVSKRTCRGEQNPQNIFICKPQSCHGSTTCESCTSQLTNALVSSIECENYSFGLGKKTTCWTSSNEQFTCTGECQGAAVCSDCVLDQQTPSISNCADEPPPKRKVKHSSTTTTSQTEAGVTTWLSWD